MKEHRRFAPLSALGQTDDTPHLRVMQKMNYALARKNLPGIVLMPRASVGAAMGTFPVNGEGITSLAATVAVDTPFVCVFCSSFVTCSCTDVACGRASAMAAAATLSSHSTESFSRSVQAWIGVFSLFSARSSISGVVRSSGTALSVASVTGSGFFNWTKPGDSTVLWVCGILCSGLSDTTGKDFWISESCVEPRPFKEITNME